MDYQNTTLRGSMDGLKWDLLQRYRLIETVALWEGRLTTRHLCEAFGIGRQQASRDIGGYLGDIAPGSLEYDKYLKGYRITDTFAPQLTSGSSEEYLQLLAQARPHSRAVESLTIPGVETLALPQREISPQIIRPLIQALREQRRVELCYVSLANPEPEYRVIAPHTLIYTPLRWHLRAYCEKDGRFKDFVLSRIRDILETMGESSVPMEQDTEWHTRVTVSLVPDPRLNAAQRAIIEHDWGMEGGRLALETRAALLRYTLQGLNLDLTKLEPDAISQQIVAENHAELRKWL